MFATSNYLTGVLTVCAIYGIWASSWDFMSGLTGRENFGHALFIGSGAYTAGFMATVWYLEPVVQPARCRRRRCPVQPDRRFPDAAPARSLLCARHAVGFGDHAAPLSHLLGIYRRRGRSLRPGPDHSLAALLLLVRPGDSRRHGAHPDAIGARALGLAAARDPRRRSDLPGRRHQCDLLQDRIAHDQRRLHRARRSALCPLSAPGQPSAVLGGRVDHRYHHGLCRRRRFDLRRGNCGHPADAAHRDAARFRRVPAVGLHAHADAHSVLPAGRSRRPDLAATDGACCDDRAARSTGGHETLRRSYRRKERDLFAAARRADGNPRPQRRRQDHAVQCPDRLHTADLGYGPLQRRTDPPARAVPGCQSRHRPHVSAGPTVRRHELVGERCRTLPFAARRRRREQGGTSAASAGASRTGRPRTRTGRDLALRRPAAARNRAGAGDTAATAVAGRAFCRPRQRRDRDRSLN